VTVNFQRAGNLDETPRTEVRVLEIVPGDTEVAELLRLAGHGDEDAFAVLLDLLTADEIVLTGDADGGA
jgi:hypothetical protein